MKRGLKSARFDIIKVKQFTMNEFAIIHTPDSGYAYPLDKNTLRLVLKVARGEKFKEVAVLWNNKYDFAKLRRFARMRRLCSDTLHDYYVCDLTSSDVRFAYVFLLTRPNDTSTAIALSGIILNAVCFAPRSPVSS